MFQNKIVDRCERLQLQSAAIARHLDAVLPAKDQGVLVCPCPLSPHGAELAPCAPMRAELLVGLVTVQGLSPSHPTARAAPACAYYSCFIYLKIYTNDEFLGVSIQPSNIPLGPGSY